MTARIRHYDISHFRAPYKNATVQGFGLSAYGDDGVYELAPAPASSGKTSAALFPTKATIGTAQAPLTSSALFPTTAVVGPAPKGFSVSPWGSGMPLGPKASPMPGLFPAASPGYDISHLKSPWDISRLNAPRYDISHLMSPWNISRLNAPKYDISHLRSPWDISRLMAPKTPLKPLKPKTPKKADYLFLPGIVGARTEVPPPPVAPKYPSVGIRPVLTAPPASPVPVVAVPAFPRLPVISTPIRPVLTAPPAPPIPMFPVPVPRPPSPVTFTPPPPRGEMVGGGLISRGPGLVAGLSAEDAHVVYAFLGALENCCDFSFEKGTPALKCYTKGSTQWQIGKSIAQSASNAAKKRLFDLVGDPGLLGADRRAARKTAYEWLLPEGVQISPAPPAPPVPFVPPPSVVKPGTTAIRPVLMAPPVPPVPVVTPPGGSADWYAGPSVGAKLTAPPPSQEVSVEAEPSEAYEEPSTLPSWVIPVAAGGVAAVVAYMIYKR